MTARKTYDFEDLVDGIKNILQANLPAAIVIQNTEKNDAYIIPNPEGYYFGYRHVDFKIGMNKAVVIVNLSTVEAENINSEHTENSIGIDAIVIHWGEKSEAVERRVMRFAKVMRKVLDENQLQNHLVPTPDNIKDSVVAMMDFAFSDFEGDVYMKSATVRVKVKESWTYES